MTSTTDKNTRAFMFLLSVSEVKDIGCNSFVLLRAIAIHFMATGVTKEKEFDYDRLNL